MTDDDGIPIKHLVAAQLAVDDMVRGLRHGVHPDIDNVWAFVTGMVADDTAIRLVAAVAIQRLAQEMEGTVAHHD